MIRCGAAEGASFTCRLLAGLCLVLAVPCAASGGEQDKSETVAVPPGRNAVPVFHRVPGNLVKNGSFEGNWYDRRFVEGRRFLLLQASDIGVGQCDGHIDHWRFEGISIPECWDRTVARAGERSVRFSRAGRGSHLIRFAGEQYWQAGGAFYAQYLPMVAGLALELTKRAIVAGAWCKTEGVPKGGEPQLTLTVECAVRNGYDSTAPVSEGRAQTTVSFSPGTHDWEYREARLDPKQLAAPKLEAPGLAGSGASEEEPEDEDLEKGETGAFYPGTPFWVTVSIAFPGKGGTAWFDDVSCLDGPELSHEDAKTQGRDGHRGVASRKPSLPNLLANASFEALDDKGWAKAWDKPAPWDWFRNTYYVFTGWSHGAGHIRGGAVIDRMISFDGNASLRFNVLPGDSFAVRSAPIELDQDKPRPIEVRAMVKADNLRTLEIMAVDQGGALLRQGDFLGDDMEEPGQYNFGSTGCGSYDWSCVRKYFSPQNPVKSMRLLLCARGFDGRLVGKNLVGTVWFDDIRIIAHGLHNDVASPPTPPVQPPPAPPLYPFRVTDISLGDRFWGRNMARVWIEFEGRQALAMVQETKLHLVCTAPSGQSSESDGSAEILVEPTQNDTRGYAILAAPFEVEKLCQSWEQQYRLSLRILAPGGEAPAAEFYFGTPSKPLATNVNGYYFYPEESLTVFANLYISRDSFPLLDRCEIVAATAGTERKVSELRHFAEILKPQTGPENIDTTNLVQAHVESEGFAVHPWSEPVCDNRISVRLYGKQGSNPLAESEPVSFGFITHFPPPDLPEKIERTAVNERGFITVNGKPYFPVYWTPHFGICPEANYPPQLFGYKAVDLTQLVYRNAEISALPKEVEKARRAEKAKEFAVDAKTLEESADAPEQVKARLSGKTGEEDELAGETEEKAPRREAPDAKLRAALLKEIEKVKDDPRFFQYELGEGEMQCQRGWQDRLPALKSAIKIIRALDPNHLINGPGSWLVGHPGHNAAMQAFVPDWDVIGVEASFEHQPKINECARPLMKDRKTAVLVGLETYFYVPNHVLRWRGYRSLLNGASGIGLCPSGMMQSRPDKVNYLRGLNGEFRGLTPVIVAPEPPEKCTVSSPEVDTMERLLDGKRYIFALTQTPYQRLSGVKFKFPEAAAYSRVRVMFEGRTIPATAEGFSDDFGQSVHVYELEK